MGFEITQGIQDMANSIPLVAGKPTVVRAHVKATNSGSQGSAVSATLTAIDFGWEICSTGGVSQKFVMNDYSVTAQ